MWAATRDRVSPSEAADADFSSGTLSEKPKQSKKTAETRRRSIFPNVGGG